jgi:hypothetical protein
MKDSEKKEKQMKTIEQIDVEIAALQAEKQRLTTTKAFTGAWVYFLPGGHYDLNWGGGIIDKRNRAAGLCFATQEDADTWYKIATRIDELNDAQGWKADWDDQTQPKRCLCIETKEGAIEDKIRYVRYPGVQWISKETHDKILEEFSQAELSVYVRGGVR